MVRVIEELMNKTLVNIDVKDKEEIIFKCDNGEEYRMYHSQDCCEDVNIDDINGDIGDLLNVPLIMAEEVTKEGDIDYGTCTWTFYKFGTVKGYVNIKWYGESNGYYSESVDIEKIK